MRIREAGPEDVPALLSLMLEMERFYAGESVTDPATAEARLSARFPLPDGSVVLLAEDHAPLGFAALFRMFPGSGLQSVWFLKELFVSAQARDRGVGERLLRAAAAGVLARGGRRLEFTTGGDNLGAQRFYARHGVPAIDKVFYRLEEAELERFAGERPD
jgi:GNAT superfamily N-acetyltransferase